MHEWRELAPSGTYWSCQFVTPDGAWCGADVTHFIDLGSGDDLRSPTGADFPVFGTTMLALACERHAEIEVLM